MTQKFIIHCDPENLILAARFWSKVKKRGKGECWLWTASQDSYGYGHFWVGNKMRSAHRVAFEYENGPIPLGMCVLHRCDNPACVNPNHLFLGTHDDNMKDMVKKRRQWKPKGASNGQAKITEEDVHFIRHWARRGHSQQEIADAFGVSQPLVCSIVSGKRWKHVA